MLLLRHMAVILGVSLGLLAMPALAVERTGGAAFSSGASTDLQLETIRTFIKSVSERLKTDITNELGFNTECASNPSACRVYQELQALQVRVAAVEARYNALPPNKLQGAEVDAAACLMAKKSIPSGCDSATHRMVWQSPTGWKCVPRASWEMM